MSPEEFQNLKVVFRSENDPQTNAPINLQFNREHFIESPLPLFQLAANERLKELKGTPNVLCAVKYQVLSKETAMVGVIKHRNKATGELENYDVSMANRVIVEKKPKPVEYPYLGHFAGH